MALTHLQMKYRLPEIQRVGKIHSYLAVEFQLKWNVVMV